LILKQKRKGKPKRNDERYQSCCCPFIFGVETADVGMDLYSAVSHDYRQGENSFTGRIKKVTIAVK